MRFYPATILMGIAGLHAGDHLLFLIFCVSFGVLADVCYRDIIKPAYLRCHVDTEFAFLLTVLHARIAKLDGQVDPKEVRMFREDVIHAGLLDLGIIGAVFNRYRKQPIDYLETATRLKSMVSAGLVAASYHQLLQGLYATGTAAGKLSTAQQQALRAIAGVFGLSLADIRAFEQELGINEQGQRKADEMTHEVDLSVLGLEKDADWPAIRRAYRGLMKQLHPDAQAAGGFTKAQQEAAALELNQVQQAYERLKKHHRDAS